MVDAVAIIVQGKLNRPAVGVIPEWVGLVVDESISIADMSAGEQTCPFHRQTRTCLFRLVQANGA